MTLAAAIAVAPDVRVLRRDQQREEVALDGLAGWARRYSSLVSTLTEQCYGLLSGIGASQRLFGDAPSLCARLRNGLGELGDRTGIAAAPTPTAAWWLARDHDGQVVSEPGALKAAIASLPIACVSLDAEQVESFHRIGVRTIGACLALPRGASARRFGKRLWQQLDRALGHQADPKPIYQPPIHPWRCLQLLTPVVDVAPLLFALGRLLREIAGTLAAIERAVQTLVLMHGTFRRRRHPGGAGAGYT